MWGLLLPSEGQSTQVRAQPATCPSRQCGHREGGRHRAPGGAAAVRLAQRQGGPWGLQAHREGPALGAGQLLHEPQLHGKPSTGGNEAAEAQVT